MNRISSLWSRVKETLRLRRRRLSLTIGLRRLNRWKNRLRPLLATMRQALQERVEPTYLEPRALRAFRLPIPLSPTLGRLQWALVTLEDLYLILQELELQMRQEEQEISETSPLR